MKTIIQLARFFKDELPNRGLIREIADFTGLERHTISTLLHNRAKYVSLESISRLSDYLVHCRGVDPAILPAALFAKEQDGFWSLLASRKQVCFSLATRTNPDWSANEYVMANDSHLHGTLVAKVSALDIPSAKTLDKRAHETVSENDSSEAQGDRSHGGTASDQNRASAPGEADERNGKRVFVDPHLVPAPRRVSTTGRTKYKTLTEGQERAAEIYSQFQRGGDSSVLFTLGSVKVNGVLEVLAGDIFKAKPFQSQDSVSSAKQRACPFYFRYRSNDPAPESLCGGTRLSKREAPRRAGIYYETEKGNWECCPCEADAHDVAFILYAYRPPVDELQFACGGFSGVATQYLAKRFVSVASQLWAPQYQSPELEVGLFLVAFDVRQTARDKQRADNNVEYKHRVIRVHEDVLARRLDKSKKKRVSK